MITANEQKRLKASVQYPGEEPIHLIPTMTTDPAAYIEGLANNYEGAEIEVWEVDVHGEIISPATKAGQAGEEKDVQQPPTKPVETKEKKPPPGMAQF